LHHIKFAQQMSQLGGRTDARPHRGSTGFELFVVLVDDDFLVSGQIVLFLDHGLVAIIVLNDRLAILGSRRSYDGGRAGEDERGRHGQHNSPH
jgi:hypothetical protein